MTGCMARRSFLLPTHIQTLIRTSIDSITSHIILFARMSVRLYILFYVYSTHLFEHIASYATSFSSSQSSLPARVHLSTSRIILHICLVSFSSVLLSFFIFSFILFRMLYGVYTAARLVIFGTSRTYHPILVHMSLFVFTGCVCRNGRHKIMGHSLYMEAIPYQNHRRQRRSNIWLLLVGQGTKSGEQFIFTKLLYFAFVFVCIRML